ncbi:MAG: tetratricopeptide repeat protein, partial [Elusimicrobiota bacterium]
MEPQAAVVEAPHSAAESLFQQGRQQYRRFDMPGYAEAVASYLEAQESDPGLAKVAVGLAETYALWGFRREISGKESRSYYELAYEAAQRVHEAAPELPEAHRAMAKAMRYGGFGTAEERLKESREAMRLNPYDVENCHELWCASGYKPEDPAIYKAMALDPDFFPAPNDMGVALCAAGRLQEAAYYFTKALQILPRHPLALCNLAMLMAGTGRTAEAKILLERDADPEDPLVSR